MTRPPTAPVRCWRPDCRDPYAEHRGGGRCRLCDCPGFTWVDPLGPAVGSYRDEPGRP